MAYQEILTLDFPEKLSKGQPITGNVLVYNPNPIVVCPIVTITLVWKGVKVECNGCMDTAPRIQIPPLATVALKFPQDFGVESVPMPEKDATLEASALIMDVLTMRKVGEGKATCTIKYVPPILEKTALGLPVWTWLIIAAIGGSATLIYLRKKGYIGGR
jgi:hypothetical protein